MSLNCKEVSIFIWIWVKLIIFGHNSSVMSYNHTLDTIKTFNYTCHYLIELLMLIFAHYLFNYLPRSPDQPVIEIEQSCQNFIFQNLTNYLTKEELGNFTKLTIWEETKLNLKRGANQGVLILAQSLTLHIQFHDFYCLDTSLGSEKIDLMIQ